MQVSCRNKLQLHHCRECSLHSLEWPLGRRISPWNIDHVVQCRYDGYVNLYVYTVSCRSTMPVYVQSFRSTSSSLWQKYFPWILGETLKKWMTFYPLFFIFIGTASKSIARQSRENQADYFNWVIENSFYIL